MNKASPELCVLIDRAHKLLHLIPDKRVEMVQGAKEWCEEYTAILLENDREEEEKKIRQFIVDTITGESAVSDVVMPRWVINCAYNISAMIDRDVGIHLK